MKLFIKKLTKKAILPKQGTPQSAGADLFACIDSEIIILPGEIVRIPTGISVEPDEKNCGVFIFARSSLASKHGVSLVNSVGVVDSDYRGEIIVALINHGNKPYAIQPNERFAQLVVMPVIFPEIIEAQALSETARGDGGFGSTGKH